MKNPIENEEISAIESTENQPSFENHFQISNSEQNLSENYTAKKPWDASVFDSGFISVDVQSIITNLELDGPVCPEIQKDLQNTKGSGNYLSRSPNQQPQEDANGEFNLVGEEYNDIGSDHEHHEDTMGEIDNIERKDKLNTGKQEDIHCKIFGDNAVETDNQTYDNFFENMQIRVALQEGTKRKLMAQIDYDAEISRKGGDDNDLCVMTNILEQDDNDSAWRTTNSVPGAVDDDDKEQMRTEKTDLMIYGISQGTKITEASGLVEDFTFSSFLTKTDSVTDYITYNRYSLGDTSWTTNPFKESNARGRQKPTKERSSDKQPIRRYQSETTEQLSEMSKGPHLKRKHRWPDGSGKIYENKRPPETTVGFAEGKHGSAMAIGPLQNDKEQSTEKFDFIKDGPNVDITEGVNHPESEFREYKARRLSWVSSCTKFKV